MPTLTFALKHTSLPLRYDFPDDCLIHVGRASSAPGLSVSFQKGRYEVRADLASLSEDHCLITVAQGTATLEDQGSRNGTFVRLAPQGVHRLDLQPVLLSKELSLRLEGSAEAPVPDFYDPTPERLLGALRANGSARSLRIELGPPEESSFPLYGDPRHLVVRTNRPTQTVSIDDLAWVQRVVNAYNTAVDAIRQELPWRFLAASRGRLQALEQARRAAPTNLPILLLGPTGAGKEVLAHDLHHHSMRRMGPFVSVNCAALDADRLEAQLFGHVRGAYTGAHADTQGFVDAAADGTLFLDEVGDMAAEVQGKLLRFLESSTGEYRRMGEVKLRHARVRIIAATLRPLQGRDNKGFREDLYYRLAGVRIDVPSLAPPDVEVIAGQLLRDASGRSAQPPSTREIELIALAASARLWPGGARELRQCVDRCVQLRAPDAGWLQSWENALDVPSPAPSIPPMGASAAQPAAVGRLLADLLFLLTARDSIQIPALARSLQMSYQAVDARLTSFELRLGEYDKTTALIEQRTQQLRSITQQSPSLAFILKGLIDQS